MILIFIIFTFSYLHIIRTYHEISLPTLHVDESSLGKNVLFIFPHPDDETMMSGGLMAKLGKDATFTVHAISVTKGDKGTEKLKIANEELAQIREAEFHLAMKILGVHSSAMWDIPDGEIKDYRLQITEKLQIFISEHHINTVITYERTGLYGHKDHVALSKFIHTLHKRDKNFDVLYATIPEKIERKAGVRNHIKNLELVDDEISQQPEYRVTIAKHLFHKYRAARAYKSQKLSNGHPLWFKIVMMPYEYYTTKY